MYESAFSKPLIRAFPFFSPLMFNREPGKNELVHFFNNQGIIYYYANNRLAARYQFAGVL